MSQPVLCVFSRETIDIPLLTIDTNQPMNDVSGKPILIKGLTPILTEYIKPSKGYVPTQIVVYHGYKGVTKSNSIFPLGMVITTEKDRSCGTEGSLTLRIGPDSTSNDWVTNSRGREISVAAGTVIAILGESRGLGIGPSKKCSDAPMVRIGIYNGNIYEGWIREAYIQRFYRQ